MAVSKTRTKMKPKTITIRPGAELVLSGVVFPPEGIRLRFKSKAEVAFRPEDLLYLEREK